MIFRKISFPVIFAAAGTIVLFSCSKTNETGTALIYNTWAFTSARGSITINGSPLGVSEFSNSNGDITVNFQPAGNYNFNQSTVSSETDGFSLSDSMITLHTDNSKLANFCAYPVLYFFSDPNNPPVITPQHVSPTLHIQFISRDSLLVKTELIKPGNNAPDTIFTEYTGFRNK